MKRRNSNSVRRTAAREKLAATIAVAQRKAGAAKKAAKLAKARLKLAKRTFKQARRAAKKLRKVVKALRAEFSSLAVRTRRRRRSAVREPVANVPVPVVKSPVESPSAADSASPPPVQAGSPSADPQD